MTLTPIGFVLIPLTLMILFFRPDYLVRWAIVVAAFHAASVINIGGGFPIGVPPYFFVVVLIAVRFVPRWLSGKIAFPRNSVVLHLCRPLLLLTLWGLISAFFLPVLFAGTPVDTPRGGMDRMFTVALQWSMSNMAQAGYLLLNCIFFLEAAWESQRYDQIRRLVWAFVWSGVIVTVVGIYQVATHYTGLAYPSEFFNSNVAWRQLFKQDIAGTDWWRLSTTFNEPSGAGAFFATWSAMVLFLAINRNTTNLSLWLWLGCGLAMLLLTVSTTGYVAAAILVALFVVRELRSTVRTGRISKQIVIAACVLTIGIIAAVALLADLKGVLSKILFDKDQTASARARGATIWEAIRITDDTWGLGVGLGSNRPSGVLFYIASNLGLPGILLIGYMIYVTWCMSVASKRYLPSTNELDSYLTAGAWTFTTEVLVMLASGTDISSPHLWITWGLLAALSQYAWMTSSQVVDVPQPVVELTGVLATPNALIVLQ